MSLRLRLFLGILLFFSVALGFFGYTAFDASLQSGVKRETALLRDLAIGIGTDLAADIGQSSESAIPDWLNAFKSPKLAVIVTSPHRQWWSGAARTIVSDDLWATISTGGSAGTTTHDVRPIVWVSQAIVGTPYTLSLVHETNPEEARGFLRALAAPLIFTAFIVFWAGGWSALFVAALIERQKAQKDRMEHQAMHDGLTALPNRLLLQDRLRVALNAADRHKTQLALLFIDLNRFKEINDTLGHSYGDRLLVEIARRLEEGLRKSDTVARLGGDEFAVILIDVTEEHARAMAEKLGQLMEKVVELDGNKLFVSGSIGIAMYPSHAQDANSLTQCADIAMYAAKRGALNNVFYSIELDKYSREKLVLTNDLRHAIEHEQLSVHYQPKVDLSSGAVIGAEALARWNHPSFGMVPPDRFIPIAEQTGLIRPLTEFVLATALRDLRQLLDRGMDTMMAINLSAVSLKDGELEAMLLRSAEKARVPTARIMLEITETSVMEKTAMVMDVLRSLDQLGFHISMDDFGTGHSSLVNLRRLPIQELKIDRAFVMNMLENEEDAAIVRAIIDLGHSLGKKVVAEGVENLEIVRILAILGCDIAQGYHFSRAVPIEEFSVTQFERCW